jgi:hypothetical protein
MVIVTLKKIDIKTELLYIQPIRVQSFIKYMTRYLLVTGQAKLGLIQPET